MTATDTPMKLKTSNMQAVDAAVRDVVEASKVLDEAKKREADVRKLRN